MSDPDLFDYLATTQVSGLTITQLDSASKNTFINKSNLGFWKGPITAFRILESSRTYPFGLSIPELGAVTTEEGSAFQVRPSGTEIWKVQAISMTNAGMASTNVTLNLGDGTSNAKIDLVAVGSGDTEALKLNFPIELTNSLWLIVTSGTDVTLNVAYQKVGL